MVRAKKGHSPKILPKFEANRPTITWDVLVAILKNANSRKTGLKFPICFRLNPFARIFSKSYTSENIKKKKNRFSIIKKTIQVLYFSLDFPENTNNELEKLLAMDWIMYVLSRGKRELLTRDLYTSHMYCASMKRRHTSGP